MSTKFVAEIGQNHGGDSGRLRALVAEACRIGCWAAKIQLIPSQGLFRIGRHQLSEGLREHIVPPCLGDGFAETCHEFGLKAGASIFTLAMDAVGDLDFLKISSYDILRDSLIRSCANSGKPLVISTGMATLEESAQAIATAKYAGCADLTVLHCISTYPTPPDEANLGAIEALRQCFRFDPIFAIPIYRVGYSDHTRSPAVIYRAVHHWQAEMVEFHLDLDGEGKEYAGGHCWLPNEIEPVIKNVKDGIEADGEGVKYLSGAEMEERKWRSNPKDGFRPME